MQVLNDKRKKETSIFNMIKYIYKRIINLISISLFRGKSNDDKVQRNKTNGKTFCFRLYAKFGRKNRHPKTTKACLNKKRVLSLKITFSRHVFFGCAYIVENDANNKDTTQRNDFFRQTKPAFCFPCFTFISLFRYDSDNKKNELLRR